MRFAFARRLRPSKTWVILGVALVIGVLAAIAARSFLSSQMAAIEARGRGDKVNVVVAKRELKRGDKLSSDNVAVRPIPVEYSQSSAISPNDFERIEGQALAYPIKAGEMILWGLMEGKKVPTFSARVENGRRAITVPVDEINSISGMVEPGDVIDLLVTVSQGTKKVIGSLLQSVQVIATGQRSVDDPKSGERRQYSTVTLLTTPEDAENIILAREAGKLTALLRNPQDKKPFGKGNVDLATLLNVQAIARTAKSIGFPEEREIPVLYGGRGTKLSTEGLRLGQPQRLAETPTVEPASAISQALTQLVQGGNAAAASPGPSTPAVTAGIDARRP